LSGRAVRNAPREKQLSLEPAAVTSDCSRTVWFRAFQNLNMGRCGSVVITSTPLRVSFFGGGTDYPVWCREHEGAVLSTTIDKYCYITCRWLPPVFDFHRGVSYSKVEKVVQNDLIQHPSVRACLQFLKIDNGIEIHSEADLPTQSGLGTSSAFTVGLLLSLHALRNEMRDRRTLALEAIYVEQDLLQEAVGSQDQVSAAYGGFNRINFHTDGSIEVKSMLRCPSRLEELEQHLALCFTGVYRTASEIATEQLRMTSHKTQELNTMYQLVNEAEGILASSSCPLGEFGRLLHKSWQIKRTLTDKVSTNGIDEIYEAGLNAGALGGKLLGAGGGGFMLFFVEPERQKALRTRLNKLLWVPFSFSSKGSDVLLRETDGTLHPQQYSQPRLGTVRAMS